MIERLLAIGIDNALAGTFLAVAVFATTRFCRRAPLAHLLWLVVLVKLVTPPVFTFPVEIPMTRNLDAKSAVDPGAEKRVVTVPRSSRLDDSRISPGTSDSDDGDRRAWEFRTVDENAAWAENASTEGRVSDMRPRGSLIATGDHLASEPIRTEFWLMWWRIAVTVWLAGTLCMIATLLSRLETFRRLLRRSATAPRDLSDEVARLAQHAGVRALPEVRVSNARIVPLVFAVGRRAVLLLPTPLLKSLSNDERTAILAHELAHLRRRDHRLMWFELFVVSIYWWHPVAWLARRQLRRAAEQCCDGWVMKWFPDKTMPYARSMMITVDYLSEGSRPVGAFAHGFGQLILLKRRFEMILENRTSYCLALPLRLSVFSAATLLLMFSPILVLGEKTQDRAPPDPRGSEAGQGDEEDRLEVSSSNPLRADVPDVGAVELLGLINSADPASGWWTADGSHAELHELNDVDLRAGGTVAAFRVVPDHLRFNGYFRIPSMIEFKETWGSERDGIILGAVDHPVGRRFGNLLLIVRMPGRPVHTLVLGPEDAGKVHHVGQFGVQAVVGMKRTGPSQFKATVLHTSDVAKEHLAAIDQADHPHVPTELSQERTDQYATTLTFQYATTLTFAFPIEQLAGIAITKPNGAEIQFRNVALGPNVEANPVATVRTSGQAEPERMDKPVIVADPRFCAELPNDVVIDLIGSVRYGDQGLTWWGPDGEKLAPVPGVLESDVEGSGTVVALRVTGQWYSFSKFIERGGGRERLRTAAFVEPSRIWLIHVDPASELEEATLVLDVIGGEPSIVQTVHITQADVGREKIVNRGALKKIAKIEAVSSEACKVEIFHEMKTPGLEIVAIDKGGVTKRRNRGSFGPGRAEMTFPLPLDQLKTIAVQQRARAEVRFAGISLQPGHRTEVAVRVKELIDPYTIEPAPPTTAVRTPEPDETPLRVAG